MSHSYAIFLKSDVEAESEGAAEYPIPYSTLERDMGQYARFAGEALDLLALDMEVAPISRFLIGVDDTVDDLPDSNWRDADEVLPTINRLLSRLFISNSEPIKNLKYGYAQLSWTDAKEEVILDLLYFRAVLLLARKTNDKVCFASC